MSRAIVKNVTLIGIAVLVGILMGISGTLFFHNTKPMPVRPFLPLRTSFELTNEISNYYEEPNPMNKVQIADKIVAQVVKDVLPPASMVRNRPRAAVPPVVPKKQKSTVKR